jgi:hypothetical protein
MLMLSSQSNQCTKRYCTNCTIRHVPGCAMFICLDGPFKALLAYKVDGEGGHGSEFSRPTRVLRPIIDPWTGSADSGCVLAGLLALLGISLLVGCAGVFSGSRAMLSALWRVTSDIEFRERRGGQWFGSDRDAVSHGCRRHRVFCRMESERMLPDRDIGTLLGPLPARALNMPSSSLRRSRKFSWKHLVLIRDPIIFGQGNTVDTT